MIIGQGLIQMYPKKPSAIKDWHPPSSVKKVCSFLGFANFYWKFIPNYSNIVAPLVFLTQKDHPWSWTPLQQCAFNSLKISFSSSPVLHIPDVSCPFSLMTDTSLLAAGTVLMWTDEAGDLHPCAYFSKTIPVMECNHDIYDCELSQSFLLWQSGSNIFREYHTLYPSSPTIKICPIWRTHESFPVIKPTGTYFYRISTLSG